MFLCLNLKKGYSVHFEFWYPNMISIIGIIKNTSCSVQARTMKVNNIKFYNMKFL